MSTIQTLRAFVNHKLTAAVEEIFQLLETTITKYEEEIIRQRGLLHDVFGQEKLTEEAGIQKVQVKEEDDQHEWSISQNQKTPALPCIKQEEQEKELCSNKEAEQLQKQEEEDATKNPSTAVSVKSEGSRDKAPLQTQTEEIREVQPPMNCGNQIREKRFSCSECHKSYTEKKALVIHMRIHAGERPYSCSWCDKTFTQRKTLVVHLRSHTGERPFSCPFCGQSFSVNGSLTRHIRVHTGEKPYGCSVCGRSFSLRARLKSHKCAAVSCNK